MHKIPWKKALYVGSALAAAALATFAMWPEPLLVDAGAVTRGRMEVTIDDQGETRCHDLFVIAAPVAGRLMRITLHDGDAVSEGQILAQIAALPQSAREREEQAARVAAAEAVLREATEHERHATDDLALARTERQRVESLVAAGGLPAQEADRARNLEVTTANEREAARYRVASARAQLEVARSGLVASPQGARAKDDLVRVHSPVTGRILRIADASERVVAPGTTLLTVGDLSRLEVVIELLSSDAVKVQPGMAVRLEGHGLEGALRARVRLVEPLAFTKVSALGIEEKRTHVVADFVDPPGPLGDGFRVEARIVAWESERVLKVPASALFQCGAGFCAFAIEEGRAVRRKVQVGHRNALDAEVLGGLLAGQQVVRHPSNDLEHGARVRIRAAGAR